MVSDSSTERNVQPDKKRNLLGLLAFLASTLPFTYFALRKGVYVNYTVIRYTLVISGFLGLALSVLAFLREQKGYILSRLGVFFAIMGGLLGISIGILALLPIILGLKP